MQQKTGKPTKNLGGRPPLPKSRRRARRAMVNLTEDEYRRLRRRDRTKSTSDLVREAVLDYLDREDLQ